MYDVRKIVENLSKEYDNAIPVFGGADIAYERACNENPNLKVFVNYLLPVASAARYFKWHEGVAGARRRFCHMCLVDPELVEAYLGMRFEEVEEHETI